MHIDSKTTIAGLPALEARNVMKKLLGFTDGFSVEDCSESFSVNLQMAKELVEAFEAEDYLEKVVRSDTKQRWTLSIKGCALAQASATKKVKRSTADRHYQAFLKRVQEINESDKFLFQVNKVALFGSYLTDAEAVSDIDLFVWLQRKAKFEVNFWEVHGERTKQMEAGGRIFYSHSDVVGWPELDVRKHLKGGSRVISVQAHNYGHEAFDCRVVFDISGNELQA